MACVMYGLQKDRSSMDVYTADIFMSLCPFLENSIQNIRFLLLPILSFFSFPHLIFI